MITLRKLASLKPGTRLRKIIVLLQGFEKELGEGSFSDVLYFRGMLQQLLGTVDSPEISFESGGPRRVKAAVEALLSDIDDADLPVLQRRINSLRHQLLLETGNSAADWDLLVPNMPDPIKLLPVEGAQKPCPPSAGPGVEIFLDDIRSPFNLGAIFRTAEALGASCIILSPDCPDPAHPRASRTSMGTVDRIPWKRMPIEEAAEGKNVFALELGGTSIESFNFPDKGLAIIGSEELGISPAARELAGKSLGLVTIPMYGTKGSLNAAVSFGILMQRWSENLHIS